MPPGFQKPVKHRLASLGPLDPPNVIARKMPLMIVFAGLMMKPLIESSTDCSVSSRILLARRPKMLPPEHRSCGLGRKSIHAGFNARMTLHTQPPKPPVRSRDTNAIGE